MNQIEETEITMPSYDELYARMLKENVREERIEWVITRLQNMSPEVEGEFLYWWHTGRILDELKVEDITIGWVLENQPYHIINVFIDFDELYRNPDDSYMYRYLRWGRTKFIDARTIKNK